MGLVGAAGDGILALCGAQGLCIVLLPGKCPLAPCHCHRSLTGRPRGQLRIGIAVSPPLDGKIASVPHLPETTGEASEEGTLMFRENARESLQ